MAGTFKPHHTSGTHPLKLRLYRYENGNWVLNKTISAKAKNYSIYSKYSVSTSLGSKGRWRVRAFHAADSANAETVSGCRYFKVL